MRSYKVGISYPKVSCAVVKLTYPIVKLVARL